MNGGCIEQVASRGVDSVGSGFKDPASVVQALARQEREFPSFQLSISQVKDLLKKVWLVDMIDAIVVMTGVNDYISDGETVIKVSNGHELVSVMTNNGESMEARY